MNRCFRAAVAAVVVAGAYAGVGRAQTTEPTLTPQERRGAEGDRTNHFGDWTRNAGPIATDLSPEMTSSAVVKVIRKVADWQLPRAERYFNQQWTFGTLYHGLLTASQSANDPKFRNAVVAMSEQFHWEVQGPGAPGGAGADLAGMDPGAADDPANAPPPPPPGAPRTVPLNANSECLGQAYLDLYFQYQDPRMYPPTKTGREG